MIKHIFSQVQKKKVFQVKWIFDILFFEITSWDDIFLCANMFIMKRLMESCVEWNAMRLCDAITTWRLNHTVTEKRSTYIYLKMTNKHLIW